MVISTENYKRKDVCYGKDNKAPQRFAIELQW